MRVDTCDVHVGVDVVVFVVVVVAAMVVIMRCGGGCRGHGRCCDCLVCVMSLSCVHCGVHVCMFCS